MGLLSRCGLLTLSYDLDLGLSMSNFEVAVFQEWDGRLTLKGRDVSGSFIGPTMWLYLWPPPWLWTQIFKVEVSQWPYLQNCRTDWRGTKRMQVGYDARPTMQPWSLTSFSDFKGQILKYMYVVVFQVRMDRLIWNNRDMNRQDDDYPVWPYPCAWPWISKVKFRKWLYPRNHFRYYFGAWQIFLSLICYIRWWWAPPRWRQKRRRFYVRHQFW